MNAINRRESLGAGFAARISFAMPDRIFPFADDEIAHRPSGQPCSTSVWLANEPVVIAGCWNELPPFRRRVGGDPSGFEQIYDDRRFEQTVKNLKDLGVTLAVVHL